MRTNHVFTTILLIVIFILVASNATNAQSDVNNGYGYEYNADGTLDYDCQTGYNIPADWWVMTCWVFADTTQESLDAIWRNLDYALMPTLYDEDMYYSWEQWLVIFDELNTIAVDSGVGPRNVDVLAPIVLAAHYYVCAQSFEACAAFNVDIAIATYNELYSVQSA